MTRIILNKKWRRHDDLVVTVNDAAPYQEEPSTNPLVVQHSKINFQSHHFLSVESS